MAEVQGLRSCAGQFQGRRNDSHLTRRHGSRPRKEIKTTGCNGSAPGPLLRLREGQAVTVDEFNDTKIPSSFIGPFVFRKKFAGHNWVDDWTINGKSFPKTDPIRIRANDRYRLLFDNQSNEAHPVHLHRHTLELTRLGATSGVRKDVIVVPAMKQVEVDFTADNPGPTLFNATNNCIWTTAS